MSEKQDDIKTITINDIEYVRKDSVPALQKPSGKIRIVILQRGWVAVGYFFQDGSQCQLDQASIIRVWGTTKGLGEIAYGGPTSKTVLDPSPVLRFHEMTVIATLDCSEAKWETKLS